MDNNGIFYIGKRLCKKHRLLPGSCSLYPQVAELVGVALVAGGVLKQTGTPLANKLVAFVAKDLVRGSFFNTRPWNPKCSNLLQYPTSAFPSFMPSCQMFQLFKVFDCTRLVIGWVATHGEEACMGCGWFVPPIALWVSVCASSTSLPSRSQLPSMHPTSPIVQEVVGDVIEQAKTLLAHPFAECIASEEAKVVMDDNLKEASLWAVSCNGLAVV